MNRPPALTRCAQDAIGVMVVAFASKDRLGLRKEPALVRDFAERLRSKLATARSAAVVSDIEWEWYIILTLWSPLQVIRLLEDSSEQAVRLRQNSPFVSLLPVPLAYRLIE